jgi:hypothetical protein
VIITLLKLEAAGGKLDERVVEVVENNLDECWRVAVSLEAV